VKRTFVVGWLLLGLSVSLAPSARGANFYIHEVGNKFFARGGAAIAYGGDLASMYTNPATLTQLGGTNFKVEINWGMMPVHYRREPWHKAIDSDNPGDPLPMAGLSTDFGLKPRPGLKRLVFAVGGYGPNGIGTYYDKDSDARYTGIETITVSAYIEAAAAYQPVDWFSIGAGAILISFVKDDQYAFTLLHDNDVRYDVVADFTANGWDTVTWTAGVWFKPWEHLQIGASYFPRVKAIIPGQVEAKLPPLYAALVGKEIYKDDLILSTWIPDIYRLGIDFPIVPGTDIEIAATYSTWSIQEDFVVDFKSEELVGDFKVERKSRDTWNFRIGGDVRVLDWWTLRAGFQFDQPSIPEDHQGPGGTETDRYQVGAGTSLYAWGCEVDLAYQHVFQNSFVIPRPSGTGGEGLGDGRGFYASSFDFFSIAFNINFNDFARAMKYKAPLYRTKGGLL
jgi:long-chain fatty acid transport protein